MGDVFLLIRKNMDISSPLSSSIKNYETICFECNVRSGKQDWNKQTFVPSTEKAGERKEQVEMLIRLKKDIDAENNILISGIEDHIESIKEELGIHTNTPDTSPLLEEFSHSEIRATHSTFGLVKKARRHGVPYNKIIQVALMANFMEEFKQGIQALIEESSKQK